MPERMKSGVRRRQDHDPQIAMKRWDRDAEGSIAIHRIAHEGPSIATSRCGAGQVAYLYPGDGLPRAVFSDGSRHPLRRENHNPIVGESSVDTDAVRGEHFDNH